MSQLNRNGIPGVSLGHLGVVGGTPAAASCPTCGQPWAQPPRPPRPAPCPPGTLRHRLACWRAWGLLPNGPAPSAIAAAFTRATGRPPARDPQRQAIRVYSTRELALALAELGHPTPPPDPLPSIWAAALQALPLPSTRALLAHQGRLSGLSEATATVAIRSDWLAMAESRREVLAQALAFTLGRPVALELRALLEVAR